MDQRLRQAAAALSGERVALQDLAAAHGPAAHGSLLVLLAAPCLLPLSGVATVLGLGLGLMALNLWRGQAAEGLPCRVARLELPLPWARRVLQLLASFYSLAGRLARERLTRIVDTPRRAWMAATVGAMAAIIVLPIPLGNLLPALALVLLGLGLALRDGVAVLLAAFTAVLALLFTAALLLGAWHWGTVGLTALWAVEVPN